MVTQFEYYSLISPFMMHVYLLVIIFSSQPKNIYLKILDHFHHVSELFVLWIACYPKRIWFLKPILLSAIYR